MADTNSNQKIHEQIENGNFPPKGEAGYMDGLSILDLDANPKIGSEISDPKLQTIF